MRTIVQLNKADITTATLGNEDMHIYDQDLFNKAMWLTKYYDDEPDFKKYYRLIKKYSHPFDSIKTTVTTQFIDKTNLKITNAYMKMYETLLYLQPYLNLSNKKIFNMYDVAGAPGMFIIAVDNYLNHFYPTVKFNWKTCSLEGGTALTDVYDLYKNNPKRYTSCDVLNKTDLKRCIKKDRYDLVTGDIGSEHDSDFTKLQEETHLDLQWGQMVLSLNLAAKNGVMFLKMYTLLTEESTYLVDLLTNYFETVHICKPITSRVINDESYIICINRNDVSCADVPLVRPKLSSYRSTNIDTYKMFENTLLDYRQQLMMLLYDIIKNKPSIGYKELLSNTEYNTLFYSTIRSLNTLFYRTIVH